MPKYKLTYFNFRAKGEIIRLMFKVAGVPFEDFRIEVPADLKPPEDWLKLKPSKWEVLTETPLNNKR